MAVPIDVRLALLERGQGENEADIDGVWGEIRSLRKTLDEIRRGQMQLLIAVCTACIMLLINVGAYWLRLGQ